MPAEPDPVGYGTPPVASPPAARRVAGGRRIARRRPFPDERFKLIPLQFQLSTDLPDFGLQLFDALEQFQDQFVIRRIFLAQTEPGDSQTPSTSTISHTKPYLAMRRRFG